MTSLIDVIFLLLLFFMLSSTFSRFAEVEISAAAGGAAAPSDTPPAFLRLSQWPRIIEAALILCEFAFLKEFADAGLRLVPIRQRDLDNNVLIDILSEEVGVFE